MTNAQTSALMNKNKDYITRNKIGTANGYDIYEYVFSPLRADVLVGNYQKPLPTLLLGASIHGGENLGVSALYYAMKNICDNYENDDLLNYLRHHVILKVVPIKNPIDYNSKRYVGYDNVNCNRDFDYKWDSTDEGAGDVPFKRLETQIYRDYMISNKDSLISSSAVSVALDI